MTSFTRRDILKCAACMLAIPATKVLAAGAFPSRPITVIVPLPAGGAADVLVRKLCVSLQKRLGQSVVVDNKPGGIYQIAMQTIARAPADGYTLIALNSGMVAAQASLRRYDLLKQLAPIGRTSMTPGAFAIPPNSAYRTLKELIEYARANPGKVNYATPGPGTLEHLASVKFARHFNLDVVPVPFKGGPDMLTALSRGDVQFAISAVPVVASFAQKKLVRVLAVTDEKRTAALPDTPTLAELGIQGLNLVFWGALAAPKGTPAHVIEALSAVVSAVLREPDLRESFAAAGSEVRPSTAAEVDNGIVADLAWMTSAAKSANLVVAD